MNASSILVVDDQEEITTVIKRFLELHGYSVDVANDPRIALEMHAERLYRIVLCDVCMPGMTGLELLQQIKVRQPTGIVIIMTAHHDISMVVSCLEAGAHDFLVKPIKSMNFLLDVIGDSQKKILRWMEALRPVSYDPAAGITR